MLELQANSPLGRARAGMGKLLHESATLRIAEARWMPVLSLRQSRVKPDAAALAEAFKALGAVAPGKPNALSGDAQRGCAWLEPHAWLLTGVQPAAVGAGLLLTDISERVAIFTVSGSAARDLIAAGCDPGMAAAGTMARTRFASLANVIVQCWGENEYRLILDVSLAQAFADWLLQAASYQ